MAEATTRYELEQALRYAIIVSTRHEKYFGFISKFLKWIAVLLSLGPVSALVNLMPTTVGTGLALLAAIVGITDVIWDPSNRFFLWNQRRLTWEKLSAETGHLQPDDLHREFKRAAVGGPTEIENIRVLSYNQMLEEHQRTEKFEKLPTSARLLNLLT
jgi:hypothetical protein